MNKRGSSSDLVEEPPSPGDEAAEALHVNAMATSARNQLQPESPRAAAFSEIRG
jgi:hypothetical protein